MKTKICTDIEQCKKLLDLGIDINTADLTVTNYPLQDGSRFDFICCKLPNDTFPSITDGKSEKIPAWSLSALMNLLPSEFTEVTITYKIDIRKCKFTDDVDMFQIAYGSYKWHEDGGYTWRDMINTGEKEDLIDATFEMVVWLKENNKI
jgi:hypothetical protein